MSERDTKHAELASYLWEQIRKDYRISFDPHAECNGWHLLAKEAQTEEDNGAFEDEMRMMLTRRIYDFLHGPPQDG